MTALAAREAYRLWAPTYETENAITHLEQDAVSRFGPSPAGKRLLDAGCGTGRRLAASGAVRAVGVDISPEMLAHGRANQQLSSALLIEGDICAMPLPSGVFDLVWCRLAIGHVPALEAAYAELARVAVPGAAVVVTDFHPAAHAAGHRRSFRSADGVVEVAHYPRSAEAHVEAARQAGLALRARLDAAIGPSVRHFYEQAGRKHLFAEHDGLPVVLGLRFARDG